MWCSPRPALFAAAAAALMWTASSCGPTAQQAAATLTGGNPERGVEVIGYYGCGSCHAIRGISQANGKVGPPLTGVASRMYLAGVLPNMPENMIRWIRNPKEFNPKTAMPVLGVTESDARDIAGYLYTLK